MGDYTEDTFSLPTGPESASDMPTTHPLTFSTADTEANLPTKANSTGATTFTSDASARPLTIWLTVPAVVVVVVAVIIIIVLVIYKKRRSDKDIVRVWQIPRTHSIPKERTTWHENEEEGEVNRSFNPDLELQPSNIFISPGVFINHDESVETENDKSVKRQSKDRETVVFNPDKMSFRLKDQPIDSNDDTHNLEVDESATDVKLEVENANVHSRHVATGYSVVQKKTKNSFKVDEDVNIGYSFAGPMDGEQKTLECADRVKRDMTAHYVGDTDKRIYPTEDESNCEYVEMTLDNDLKEGIERDTSEVHFRQNGNDSDSVYSNVEIERAQSAHVMPSFRSEIEEHLPRRIASETKIFSKKPPKPQPRPSKRSFDPYDYPPGVPIRTLFSDTLHENDATESIFDNKATITGKKYSDKNSARSPQLSSDTLHEEERPEKTDVSVTNCIEQVSDMYKLETDDIYDYPRKQTIENDE